ncbi:MAG: putative glycoside hydrolase, partial [Candidatus Sungbacteria bacterium]|nr:putative glycoside hydrolase [Candidatus Sungbacteria bacterium]
MKYFFYSLIAASTLLGGGIVVVNYYHPSVELSAGSGTVDSALSAPKDEKTIEERIRAAQEKSSRIKGLYMTADVANDQGAGAVRLRNEIIRLADTTEINGIVIDTKEVCGPDYDEDNLKKLIQELHQKNIWAIGRVTVFKDASQIDVHPEWYLKRSTPKAAGDECSRKRYLKVKNPEGKSSGVTFWRDNRGGYWLDPAHEGAQNYIISFTKQMIDIGFDEIQFDYIRFPSDGDVEKADFPAWDHKTPKYVILKHFFELVDRELRQYKPDIILSADLFGYAAIRSGDVGIGQGLEDIGSSFDYVSFMVYPSHYYNGLSLPANIQEGLPAINLNAHQARLHPDITVGRSLLVAKEFLESLIASS